MSRVHDALRRAEQSGVTPPVPVAEAVPAAAPPPATVSVPAPVSLSGGELLGPDFWLVWVSRRFRHRRILI